jgi:hypothetical protein
MLIAWTLNVFESGTIPLVKLAQPIIGACHLGEFCLRKHFIG